MKILTWEKDISKLDDTFRDNDKKYKTINWLGVHAVCTESETECIEMAKEIRRIFPERSVQVFIEMDKIDVITGDKRFTVNKKNWENKLKFLKCLVGEKGVAFQNYTLEEYRIPETSIFVKDNRANNRAINSKLWYFDKTLLNGKITMVSFDGSKNKVYRIRIVSQEDLFTERGDFIVEDVFGLVTVKEYVGVFQDNNRLPIPLIIRK